MSDEIYTGWGNRTRVKGAIKRRLLNADIQRRSNTLAPSLDALRSELQRLSLNSEDGLSRLAALMATDILTTLGADETTVDALPFTKHLTEVITSFFRYEEPFILPSNISAQGVQARSDLWLMEEVLGQLHRVLTNFDQVTGDIAEMFCIFVKPIIKQHPNLIEPEHDNGDELCFSVPLIEATEELASLVEAMVQLPFAPELEPFSSTEHHRLRLEHNMILASGGMPGDQRRLTRPRMPSQAPSMSPSKLIEVYLGGTPLADLLSFPVPIPIPLSTRFEHHHIVAGSGHGKTQTLQHLILHDLGAVMQGKRSVVVIDSQGDLIRNISSLSLFAPGQPLADRLVVIDPTDIEYPVALNLFDVGMDRIKQSSPLEQERTINGVLELYGFVLSSLLDAQMTQKQSVIFRYITRLMLQIPNATIATFRELLGEGGSEKYRSSIARLTGSSRDFFETEFDSREFAQTKKQVLRRLWGILENQTFERMFLHPKSKLDLFSEMNSGKVILINTAKDLLKEAGTEFLGRFFIAMIAQAAQERSVIPEHQRMPTFVYIDEAADYFDSNIGIILSQARKYKVGMILAHQYLGQLGSSLQNGVFANTSIKFAGGVSSKDARALAAEMRTDESFIEKQEKLELAAFVRGTTKTSVAIKIQYGLMERLPQMSGEEKRQLRGLMRNRYAVHYDVMMQSGYQAGSADDNNEPADTTGDGSNESAAGDEGSDQQSGKADDPKSWD